MKVGSRWGGGGGGKRIGWARELRMCAGRAHGEHTSTGGIQTGRTPLLCLHACGPTPPPQGPCAGPPPVEAQCHTAAVRVQARTAALVNKGNSPRKTQGGDKPHKGHTPLHASELPLSQRCACAGPLPPATRSGQCTHSTALPLLEWTRQRKQGLWQGLTGPPPLTHLPSPPGCLLLLLLLRCHNAACKRVQLRIRRMLAADGTRRRACAHGAVGNSAPLRAAHASAASLR